ncbi:PAS domain-containing sensor histidine kinase [Duganella sp. P38]|uniref:sensor histidine kinase n=1 Tax=Duganella sp. P38 TaxID=3423949 RepID=UPI003D7A0153
MDQALATICPPAVDGLLRAVDWARSPLGPVEAWPAPLRFTVDLMTHSESSMFLVWGEQRIFLYNEAYLPVLGNKHPRALGRPMVDSWNEVWDEVSVLLQRTFDGESLRFENHPFLIHRDGREEQAWFDFSYTPIYGAAQQVLGVLCILSEKTGQVLAERALKQQADMLQQLFADAPGFMALLRGPQHVFELANHSYRELIGGRDPLRQRLRDALPEIVDQGFPELLDRVYHTGEPFFGRRVPVTLQRGGQRDLEQRWVDFMYQPVFDNEGRVNGVFVQGTDVTHHVHTEQELQQAAQRAAEERDRKDEFLAMLAHELRNPLAPIRAATDLLHLGQPDPARHARAVAVIDRQVRHMTTLVDDLLDVSRVTRGLVELDLRPTDLKTVIAAALEQARPLIEARGHALHVHTDAAHAMVRGDAPRLIQIVVNLLSNAAKYAAAGRPYRCQRRAAGRAAAHHGAR